MRLCCIACEVLARPLYLSAARSPHIVDIQLFRRGLHDIPVVIPRAHDGITLFLGSRSEYDRQFEQFPHAGIGCVVTDSAWS